MDVSKYSKMTFFDFETCGLKSPVFAVSVAYVYYENFKKVDSGYFLINPEHPIEKSAYFVHKISEKQVANEPNFPTIWRKIKKYFAPDVLLIGHNVNYDLRVIKDNLEYYGIERQGGFKTLCTCNNARKLIAKDEINNYKLNTVCDYLEIPFNNHHDALADTIACKDILNKLLRMGKAELDIVEHDFK